MARFFRRRQPDELRRRPAASETPVITSSDLDRAETAIRAYEQAVGTNDPMWDALQLIAQTGGALSAEDLLRIHFEEKRRNQPVGFNEEYERPWYWWRAVAKAARMHRRPLLAGRIFLFAIMFRNDNEPVLRPPDWLQIGMGPVGKETLLELASEALLSLSEVDNSVVVAGNPTGSMEVGAVCAMAGLLLEELADEGVPISHDLRVLGTQAIDQFDSD